jgi:hypothetical protein
VVTGRRRRVLRKNSGAQPKNHDQQIVLASNVAAEMELSVLAYSLTRVMNIVGVKPSIAAIVA